MLFSLTTQPTLMFQLSMLMMFLSPKATEKFQSLMRRRFALDHTYVGDKLSYVDITGKEVKTKDGGQNQSKKTRNVSDEKNENPNGKSTGPQDEMQKLSSCVYPALCSSTCQKSLLHCEEGREEAKRNNLPRGELPGEVYY